MRTMFPVVTDINRKDQGMNLLGYDNSSHLISQKIYKKIFKIDISIEWFYRHLSDNSFAWNHWFGPNSKHGIIALNQTFHIFRLKISSSSLKWALNGRVQISISALNCRKRTFMNISYWIVKMNNSVPRSIRFEPKPWGC